MQTSSLPITGVVRLYLPHNFYKILDQRERVFKMTAKNTPDATTNVQKLSEFKKYILNRFKKLKPNTPFKEKVYQHTFDKKTIVIFTADKLGDIHFTETILRDASSPLANIEDHASKRLLIKIIALYPYKRLHLKPVQKK